MEKLQQIKNKIIPIDKIESYLSYWKFNNLKIVFTNGCFDILHRGHVEYLSKASDLGDILLIGLNSDASVKKLKGPTRPINDQESRAILLASLGFVSAVCFFEEDTPYNLIKIIEPDILVKGNDYKVEEIVGYDILKNYGGSVVTIQLVEGFSTTSIEKKLNLL